MLQKSSHHGKVSFHSVARIVHCKLLYVVSCDELHDALYIDAAKKTKVYHRVNKGGRIEDYYPTNITNDDSKQFVWTDFDRMFNWCIDVNIEQLMVQEQELNEDKISVSKNGTKYSFGNKTTIKNVQEIYGKFMEELKQQLSLRMMSDLLKYHRIFYYFGCMKINNQETTFLWSCHEKYDKYNLLKSLPNFSLEIDYSSEVSYLYMLNFCIHPVITNM